MSYIFLPNRLKHNKDCADWCPLQDGTKVSDPKYCGLSLQCRQIGMKSDYYEYFDHTACEYVYEYFCTGFYVTEENKKDDDEVS